MLRYIIVYEKFDYGIYFCQTTLFDPFWGTLAVKWGSKGSTVYLSKNSLSHRSFKFAGKDISHRKFDRYCHSFRTNYKFWPFSRQPGGQMGIKKVKNYQPCLKKSHKNIENLRKHIHIFHKKSNVVTYLLHNIVFESLFDAP